LSELLSYLSSNDYHASTLSADGNSTVNIEASSQQITEGAKLVACQDHAYHIGREQVVISGLDGTGSPTSAIAGEAEQLFVFGDRLVTVNSYVSGGSELDEERSVSVKIYDASNPDVPMLVDEFIQLGSMVACYQSGDDLFLMTADGVCACGWSRLDDTDGYVPALSQNGAAVAWEDHEICILGEPTSVQYIAATMIDVRTGAVTDKQAFYGDIDEVFYGSGWQAITTQATTDNLMLHPDIYTFSTKDSFEYTGKISTASLLELEAGVRLSNGRLPDGSYPAVKSVTMADGVYRAVGEYVTISGDNQKTELLAITADMKSGAAKYDLLALDNSLRFDMHHLLWEESRAIVTVTTMKLSGYDVNVEGRLFFVEFSGMDIRTLGTELRVDVVTGVDGTYAYGNPFGELEPIIPMGGGIYLRYNGTPDGIDVFDFSDSAAPQLIYDSPGDIPADSRFEFEWKVYDENTFGIMVLTPGAGGEYRDGTFSWNIYRVDAENENPYTLLTAVDLGKEEGFYASNLGFETLEHEGAHYFITVGIDRVQRIEW